MPLDRPIPVVFFRLDSGREPVREWLKGLTRENRKSIGEDIKTLQFGWPVGMPLARKIGSDIWELEVTCKCRNCSDVFYCVSKKDYAAAWLR